MRGILRKVQGAGRGSIYRGEWERRMGRGGL